MKRRCLVSIRALALTGVMALLAGALIAEPSEATAARKTTKKKGSSPGPVQIVVYDGKLQSSEGKAISGIYPLRFEIHRRARGGRAMWKETHYVAVDSGTYSVELGRSSKIRGSIDLSRVFLGVSLGKKELLREKIDRATVQSEARSPSPVAAPVPATPAASPQPAAVRKKDGRTVVDYAEEAGEAYVAGQAKVAERIGSLKAKDIEDAVKKLKNFKGGGARLGTSQKTTQSVGGTRGVEYTLKCPKGHVVTGVSGGAGLYIDSLKLICQPLE